VITAGRFWVFTEGIACRHRSRAAFTTSGWTSSPLGTGKNRVRRLHKGRPTVAVCRVALEGREVGPISMLMCGSQRCASWPSRRSTLSCLDAQRERDVENQLLFCASCRARFSVEDGIVHMINVFMWLWVPPNSGFRPTRPFRAILDERYCDSGNEPGMFSDLFFSSSFAAFYVRSAKASCDTGNLTEYHRCHPSDRAQCAGYEKDCRGGLLSDPFRWSNLTRTPPAGTTQQMRLVFLNTSHYLLGEPIGCSR
jgi:hypothetical protein